ncbi:MAG: 50S ribosomal protein L6 [Bacteroidetes bacterium]|nr:MAG: 50S ribosomal protein L6 [Bacteroidota bacterium]RLD92908.1 MAG: 50S ribosomal protein L6 [Bacteroidota bacterium]
MSRIGILPIDLPAGVSIEVDSDNLVTVKGPKGELQQQVDKNITVKAEDNQISVSRSSEVKDHKAKHGLYRSLMNNMVIGVSEGYTIKQELVGVGYRAEVKGNNRLELSLGFSHDIFIQMPAEVKVEAVTERRANPVITLTSIDKQLIGEVAAKIRSFRPPEPYKGKGIKFVGEQLRRKAGKAASV